MLRGACWEKTSTHNTKTCGNIKWHTGKVQRSEETHLTEQQAIFHLEGTQLSTAYMPKRRGKVVPPPRAALTSITLPSLIYEATNIHEVSVESVE